MSGFFSQPRFLAVYSASLTTVFVATTAINVWYVPHAVSGAEKGHTDFDQLTVHRINIVEPNGTPRLVISDKDEFPGGFYMGKEFTRADRSSAGMLFMDDEGTENGGMLFGGNKDANGQLHSYGHLSFDGYQQDQSMSLDANQDGDQRSTSYQVNDNIGDTLFTPDFLAAVTALRAMPDGPEKQKNLRTSEPNTPTPCASEPLSVASRTNPPFSASATPKATLESCCGSTPPVRLRCSSSTPQVKSFTSGNETSIIKYLNDVSGVDRSPKATPGRHKHLL